MVDQSLRRLPGHQAWTRRGAAPDSAWFDTLHAYFLDRLLPVCAQLFDAAVAAGEIRSDLEAYELMRGVGNLCIGADSDDTTTRFGWSNFSLRDSASTSGQ